MATAPRGGAAAMATRAGREPARFGVGAAPSAAETGEHSEPNPTLSAIHASCIGFGWRVRA